MDHDTMCRWWRFGAPKGKEFYFQGELGKEFKSRLFDHFGGFTPNISKNLGWEK